MTRAPYIVAAAGVLAGIAGMYYGWRQHKARAVAESRLAAAPSPRHRAATMPGRSAPKDAPQPTSSPSSPLDEKAVLQRYQQSLARQRAKEAIAGAEQQQQFMAARETQEQLADQFRANLRLRYGAFYTAAHLTEQQINAFEQGLLEKFWTMSDVLFATRASGASDQATEELRRQQLAAADARLKAAIGDPLFQSYLGYETTADARYLVDTLAGKTYYREPLTAEQAAQLARIITSHASAVRPDEWLRQQVFAGSYSGVSWSEVQWESVTHAAAGLLSPGQLATLRTLAADARLKQAVEQKLKEADRQGRDSMRGGN